MKLDLHVHTSYSSDAINPPRAIVRAALRRGLAGIAVTDHNFIGGAAKLRRVAPPDFLVIAGVEYSTDFGHILALFCEEFADSLSRDARGRYKLDELAPFLKERGAVLVCAHPFQYAGFLNADGSLRQELFSHIHGLEAMNSRALSRKRNNRELVDAAAAAHGVFTVGGSDAHFPWEVGRCFTKLPEGTRADMDAVREAILQGHCEACGEAGKAVFRYMSRGVRKLRRDK
jgi:predicted metal-dependent phosphoesterase TrpH